MLSAQPGATKASGVSKDDWQDLPVLNPQSLGLAMGVLWLVNLLDEERHFLFGEMAWASLTQRNIPRHFSVSNKLLCSPERSKAGSLQGLCLSFLTLVKGPLGSWLPFQAQPEDKNAWVFQCGLLE